MNHKIIEKEISWDDFVAHLMNSTVVQQGDYCFDIGRVKVKGDNIMIYNGPPIWMLASKEDNQTVKYGSGSFYVCVKRYDYKELEETDYDGNPTFEKLSTYKIVEKEIKLHQLHFLKKA